MIRDLEDKSMVSRDDAPHEGTKPDRRRRVRPPVRDFVPAQGEALKAKVRALRESKAE